MDFIHSIGLDNFKFKCFLCKKDNIINRADDIIIGEHYTYQYKCSSCKHVYDIHEYIDAYEITSGNNYESFIGKRDIFEWER